MNADCAFVTGKSHRVCQDYARSKGNYVIISDGCSSIPDSDFGSRLLVKIAEESPDPFDIKQVIIDANSVVTSLALPKYCTDATLLFAKVEDSNVIAKAWGDGVIAAKKTNGDIEAWNITYPSGYPMYPSYLIDDRGEKLTNMFNGNNRMAEVWNIKGEIEKWGNWSVESADHVIAETVENAFEVRLKKADYSMVAIFTDGITSFVDGQLCSVHWRKILRQMLDIPAVKGEFVQRQMNWMVKECIKNKWKHDDDFTMGAINIG